MKLYYATRVSIPSSAAQSVQIDAMCEAFGKQNIEFKLISTSSKYNVNLQKEFFWDKIKVNSRFKYLEFSVKSFFKVVKEKPNCIFTRDIIIAFILSFLNLKVMYEVHKEPKTIIASLILKYLKYKDNFYLMSISRALKDYYIEEYHFNSNKILDYHDGVFIEKYNKYRDISKNDLRENLGLAQDKTIIMHTGSLYKGNDAKLFKTVVDNFKEILFVQVGGNKSDISKYKEFYKSNKNIVFIGHQSHEDIIKYQMSADLLFYALTKSNNLWKFTSPLKLFEYMATGIPILGSNIGSVGEVLTSKNAIIFHPEDNKSIIDGVRYFLENKKKCEILAQNALKDIESKYTWEKRVENILEFIK